MVAEDGRRGRGPGPGPGGLSVGRFNLRSRQMALTEHRHQLGRKIRGLCPSEKLLDGRWFFFLTRVWN